MHDLRRPGVSHFPPNGGESRHVYLSVANLRSIGCAFMTCTEHLWDNYLVANPWHKMRYPNGHNWQYWHPLVCVYVHGA